MFYFQLEGFKPWPFWVPKSISISLALLWSVAESDLQLGKEGGGGRFSLACPASFSSFIDFFTQNKEGDGLGRVSWWHLAKRCLLSSRDFHLQTPALLKAELITVQYSIAPPPPLPSYLPPNEINVKGCQKTELLGERHCFLIRRSLPPRMSISEGFGRNSH